MGFSTGQLAALSIVPKIGGFLSLMGSVLILREVVTSHRRNSNNHTSSSFSSSAATSTDIQNGSGDSSSLSALQSSLSNRPTRRKRRKNQQVANSQKVYQRLLGGMSLCDIVSSTGYVFSTWMVPNRITCTMQGFMVHFGGCGAPVYNALLAIYYLLVIKYNWKDEKFQKTYIEIVFHIFGLGIGALLPSIIALYLKLYGSVISWCWIVKEQGEDQLLDGDLYRFLLGYSLIWCSLIIATVCMIVLYCFVRKQERTNDRYATSGYVDDDYQPTPTTTGRDDQTDNDNVVKLGPTLTTLSSKSLSDKFTTEHRTNSIASSSGHREQQQQQLQQPVGQRQKTNKKRSEQVFDQAFWYLLAFYMTWLFATVNRILQAIAVTESSSSYWFLLLHTVFAPLQGFFNLLVYMRPRYIQEKKHHPHWSSMRIIQEILRLPRFNCCRNNSNSTTNDHRRRGCCCNLPCSTTSGQDTVSSLWILQGILQLFDYCTGNCTSHQEGSACPGTNQTTSNEKEHDAMEVAEVPEVVDQDDVDIEMNANTTMTITDDNDEYDKKHDCVAKIETVHTSSSSLLADAKNEGKKEEQKEYEDNRFSIVRTKGNNETPTKLQHEGIVDGINDLQYDNDDDVDDIIVDA